MKINIVGGGPAGLYFAILMKARDSSIEINLYERTSADQTWGWGVVFSSKTLAYLGESDPIAYQRLQEQLVNWTDVVMLYRGDEVRVKGNPFSAIARLKILQTLQERAIELGVSLHFETEIDDPSSLRDCDLLIGADGISSLVRTKYQDRFEPEIQVGTNKFIWLGTKHLFTGLTLGFAETKAGAFACHAYRFCDDTSTFIAECTEETWRQSGLDNASEAESLSKLSEIFASELEGQSLMSNNSKWINFRRVKNKNWHYENIVLLGDALHTAHFSIGSGTKLAMEDSIALFECLGTTDSVAEALPKFESTRRPAVEKLQRAAETSRIWFENMDSKLGPPPHIFSYDCMTRSGRVDLELLREQDSEFVSAFERERGQNL
ncbi:MAG: FAD-dependent monooxygenase [Kofleriaceae bacterium]|nr:FAD-dependent monooxygenase [Kofleriaceae bacterium]